MSYQKYKELLKPEFFKIPILDESEALTFPEYLKMIHDSFLNGYEQNILEDIERKTNYIGVKDAIYRRMKLTCYHLQKVIIIYYEGDIIAATKRFNWVLDKIIDVES